MDLRTYTLEELESYAGSSRYGKSGIVPVSPLRLISYLNNPRAEKKDPVLFEMYAGDRLVAYRTLLPDLFYDKKGRSHRFAWLSGNYVDPGSRRQGISTKLFRSAEDHWEGRLMYTNYAPASRAVYDHTGKFRMLKEREGKRYYLRASSRELMSLKGIKGYLLGGADWMINKIHDRKLAIFKPDQAPSYTMEEIGIPDRDIASLIERMQEGSLFRRDMTVFRWILRYPWVTDRDEDPIPYHFSYRASLFKNQLLKFTIPGMQWPAILWMVIHDNKLTVPYAMSETGEMDQAMTGEIIRTMILHGCAYTTLRKPSLVRHMNRYKKWFLLSRDMPQLIFVHEKILGIIPADRVIHDGDGDVVFTG